MARIVSEHKDLAPDEIYIEKGWELVQEGPDHRFGDYTPIGFLLPDEQYVWLEELRKRAIWFGANVGMMTAEWFVDHQDLIPEHRQRFNLVFPATLWRDRTGSLRVPYLAWTNGRWTLMFYWSDQKFNSLDKIMHYRA